MSDTKREISDFINDLYTTKSARFCAERRLRRKQLLSHVTISILSAYIICIGAIPFYDLPIKIDSAYLQFTTFALSIFLLVISLLEIGADRINLANKLHENGIKINNIYKKATLNNSLTDINEIREIYNNIILSCEYNHEKIDYFEVVKNNTHHSFWKRIPFKLHYIAQWFLYYGLYWVLIITPPMILTLYSLYVTIPT